MKLNGADIVVLDGVRYAVRDPQLVNYAMHESPEQRKARGEGAAPAISYTVATIERVRDE
jgi:hypothetical protein